MADYTPCQVCKHNSWEILTSKTFNKSDIDTVDDFNKEIFQFMFEDWFPGQLSIKFQNIICNNCGFVSFSPRPTVDDIDKLRRRPAKSTVVDLPEINLEVAELRSRYMYDYLDKYYDLSKTQRVLDYGGMDGNLMDAFLKKGKNCSLIDYCTVCIDGITKIGNTVYDLSKDDKFDLIICNHIVEHLADPQETLKILLEHLTENGILFIEVPMELWKYPPLRRASNPITHVNFFSPNSLSNLFIASGGSVMKCELVEFLYFHIVSSWNPGIRCVGRRKEPGSKNDTFLKPDSFDFLKPNLKTYFRYYFGNPREFRSQVAKRLKFW